MQKNKLAIILLSLALGFCETLDKPLRIGHFQKIVNDNIESNEFELEKALRTSTDCYWFNKYHFDEDYIDRNLKEMAKGDQTIVGFRNLDIEYTYYPIWGDILGSLGRTCITFSGYAIRKKAESSSIRKDK